MSDDPEVTRNRAIQAARIAANKMPHHIEFKLKKFWNWNGDPPPPQITHRTERGIFVIRGYTPRLTSMVLFDGNEKGLADYTPSWVARLLFNGNFDKELGFPASKWLPPDLSGWNDLGG